MMPTYRCEAIHVANVVCVVEAESLADAVQKFMRGHYDEFFNEKNDEAIECDVATVKLDIEVKP
jgi:enamine deaminase RidA (YjgF/YER057c/UK114 family)